MSCRASEPGAPPRRGADRRATADAGLTLIELVVSMSLLAIVAIMSSMVMLGTRKVAEQVTWRANNNSQLRELIDATFADLSSARPPALCIDAACDRITESRSDPGDPSSPPLAVVVSADDFGLCYLSQRSDAIGLADARSVLQPYWKVCLRAELPPASAGGPEGQRELYLSFHEPLASDRSYGQLDAATAFSSAPTSRRRLALVDVRERVPFRYTDLGGLLVPGGELSAPSALDAGGLLARIAKVELRLQVTDFDAAGRARQTGRLSFTAALRSSRYQQERYWNGDRSVGGP
jgi:prepilin-type N-terminal cleavage/methylation domain-containing protein